MAKGNPRAYLNAKNNPITDSPDITEDENRNILSLCMEGFNAPLPDLSDPEQVKQAIDNYFSGCARHGLRPGNLGLYGRLGLTKQEVHNELTGFTKKLSPASLDLLKKAVLFLREYRESLGATGKLNPVTLIFWQKNYDGLTDTQTIEVSARDTSTAEQTPEEIAAALEADVIQDN
ncbi:MAG: hypothetical protein VZR95_10195 [Alphaproteobacteria bacterium]